MRQASDRNYPPAQCSLGLCYELGTGVPEDKKKAVELYTEAAEAGDETAQCNLGFCYLIAVSYTHLLWGLMAMGPETLVEVPPILAAVSSPKTAAPFSAALT